ncbi:MAG: hypothetical protein Kow0029_09950 [Candidatus Rifleibacteriota bacterium]
MLRGYIFRIFWGVLLLIVLSCSVSAKEVVLRTGEIKIFLPDSWKNSFSGDMISSESPDGGVAILFALLQNSQLDNALQEAEASILDAVGQIFPNGEVLDFMVNGMPATMQKGIAQNGLTSVSLTLILTPNKRWLMILYMGSKEREAIWRSYLNDILKGVKPLK